MVWKNSYTNYTGIPVKFHCCWANTNAHAGQRCWPSRWRAVNWPEFTLVLNSSRTSLLATPPPPPPPPRFGRSVLYGTVLLRCVRRGPEGGGEGGGGETARRFVAQQMGPYGSAGLYRALPRSQHCPSTEGPLRRTATVRQRHTLRI